MDEERLSWRILADKTTVVAFVRPGVSQDTVEMFDEEFAKGRDIGETWVVHPTRSHGECGVEELLEIATTKFKAADCEYYPYFVILIDDRTTQDGTVLLGQQDPWYPQYGRYESPHEPEDDDPWAHDVPFDYSATNQHQNLRHLASLSQDENRQQNAAGFSRVTVDGLTIQWYGEVPESVLVLSGVYNGKRKVRA